MNKDFLLKKKWLTIFFATILGVCLPLFSGCSEDDNEYVEPNLTIEPADGISIDQTNGATGTFTINSTRDWSIEKPSDTWLSVVPMTGKAGKQEITVTVKENTGKARASVLNITASSLKASIEIRQKSKDGTEDLYTSIAALRDIFKTAEKDGKVTTADDGTITYTVTEDLMVKGVVISDRNASNLNSKKAGYIQDVEGNGVNFRSDKNHEYDMGTQLIINLNGGTLSRYKGKNSMQLGILADKVTATEGVIPTPIEVTIDELFANGATDGKYDGVLVKVKDAQFENITQTYYSGNITFAYHDVTSCGTNIISVPFSKYMADDFKNKTVRKGKGSFIGIAVSNLSYDEWNVYPRNENDLEEMSDDESTRCVVEKPNKDQAILKAIADIKKIEDGKITENIKVKGIVTSDKDGKNINGNNIFIQDENHQGFCLRFAEPHSLAAGTEVEVWLFDGTRENFNDLNQVSGLPLENIINQKQSSIPAPFETTIAQIKEGNLESVLVEIKDVEFKDISQKYKGGQTIQTCSGEEMIVYTSNSVFADNTVAQGNGSIVGNVSINKGVWQLCMRNADDAANMNGARCNGGLSITLDPKNFNLDAEAHQNVEVNVISGNTTLAWTATVEDGKTWCTLAENSGVGTGKFTFNIEANSGEQRTVNITVSAIGVEPQTITIIQNKQGQTLNLVQNADFTAWTNDTPDEWFVKPQGKEGDKDKGSYKEGSSSILLKGKIYLSQSVTNIIAGKTYTISYEYNQANDEMRHRIWSNWSGNGSKLTENKDVLQPSTYIEGATSNWKKISLELKAPNNADAFNFEIRAYATNKDTFNQETAEIAFRNFQVIEK